MKRSPLSRTSGLKRSPMKRRKRRARPGKDDAVYLRWIRRQLCCVPGCPAGTPVHAHHITGAGMGKKAGDRETLPLCSEHHRDLHEFRGFFSGMTRELRAAWQQGLAGVHRALYERQRAA